MHALSQIRFHQGRLAEEIQSRIIVNTEFQFLITISQPYCLYSPAQMLGMLLTKKSNRFKPSFVLLLLTSIIMLNEYVIAKMIFMTIQENSSIHGIEPFYQDKNMNSMLKCFLLCQQQHDRCLFVEVSTSQNNIWSCRLFDLNEDVGQYLVPLPDTVVSAPRSIRCCLNWRYQGFAKNGVYYIAGFKIVVAAKSIKNRRCTVT